MPNMATAEEAICQAFKNAWALNSMPLTEWPNVAWPVGTSHPREGQEAWAAIDILHDGSDQTTLAPAGRRTFERSGTVVVRLFVPAGERGLADATALAMVVTNAYEGKTIEGVRFYRVGAKTVGRDGSWFQMNVVADFEFDEIK